MKRLFVFCSVQAFCCTIAFSQNPRWAVFGTRIPPRTNLSAIWEAHTNNIPSNAAVYRLTGNAFSGRTISNLLTLSSLAWQDKRQDDANGISFQSPDGIRKLSVSFQPGVIRYDAAHPDYGPTNLAVGVPPMDEMPRLATNVLKELGLNFSDIIGYFGSSRFEISEPTITTFSHDGLMVTNIPSREIYFRRCVDGMPVSGGDGGRINFGEHHRISRILISWHKLELLKTFPTYSPDEVVRLLHEGKCFQGPAPGNISEINWPTVKGVVIKKAKACYCAGKSDLLYPFLALTATIDTDEGKVDMELDSPIIDEAQPLTER